MPGNQRNLELKLCLVLSTAVKQKTIIQSHTPKEMTCNSIVLFDITFFLTAIFKKIIDDGVKDRYWFDL